MTYADSTDEFRRQLAGDVVERLLQDVPRDVLGLVGSAVRMADWPVSLLGGALVTVAEGPVWLAGVQMSYALGAVQSNDLLLERMSDAREPPWSIIASAIRKLRAA